VTAPSVQQPQRRAHGVRGAGAVAAAEGRAGYAARVRELGSAVDRVSGTDLGGFGITELQRLLQDIEVPLRRLEALRGRLANTLREREIGAAAPGDERRAEQRATRFLTDGLQLAPGEAKRTTETSRRLAGAPLAGAAFDEGALSRQHVEVITRALAELPPEARPAAERDLVDLARTADPTVVGRDARRRVASADAELAQRAADRAHSRRRAGWSRRADGGLAISALLYGVAAEQVEVALTAATPAPTSTDTRTHDQRRADGLADLCALTLRAGSLPLEHGVRPHVTVTVTLDQLQRRKGVAELGSGEVLPLQEARLLSDCAITRVVLGLDGAPIEVSVTGRTVPAALVRALRVRDRHCTWPGCRRPTKWCQVAHGDVPYAAGGELTLDNCALLCSHHHRVFDRGGWRMDASGHTVTYTRDPRRPDVVTLVGRTRSRSRPDRAVAGRVAGNARAAPTPDVQTEPSRPSSGRRVDPADAAGQQPRLSLERGEPDDP
jgi:hypothetical protein